MARTEIAAMAAAEDLRQREARTQVSVEPLVQDECTELEGGHPRPTLPARVARMILDDHKAGHSRSSI